MGPRQEAQAALFYEFSLEDHVPQDHLLRSIDRFVDLSDIRQYLAEFYSHTGRPSIDPELLIRMLLVGYDTLRKHGAALQNMQSKALTDAGIAHRICGDETLFDLFFTDNPCRDYRTARHDNPRMNVVYNDALRANGVFKSPGKMYPSLALTQDDLALTRNAIEQAIPILKESLGN